MDKIIYKLKEKLIEIKWKIQRTERCYSDMDTWNFDEYVAKIIKENCFILAENNNGYPGIVTEKEWKKILLDISFGFGSYLEMRSGIYEEKDKEFKRLKKEYENGLKLFSKYHSYLWD